METVGEATLRNILAFTALKLEMVWMAKTIHSTAQRGLLIYNEKRINQIEETLEKLLHLRNARHKISCTT